MKYYIDSTLVTNEKVIYRERLSLWGLSGLILLGIVTLPIFGIGLYFLAVALIRYLSTELAFTNKRVIVKTGWISRNTIEMNISKVESIQVDQTALGRIFNYGSLVISGAGNPQAPVLGVAKPMAFRNAFMEFQSSL